MVFNQQTFRGNNRDLATSFNTQFPALLQAYSDRGINVHYFDVDSLLTRLRANPTAFGYIPQAALGSCSADPACAPIGYLNGGAAENQYISVDGVHLTGRTNSYIAAFVSNQLNAPLTSGPQGELGQSVGLAFSSTLIDFLSAERRRNMVMSVPVAYSADLPGRTAPPSTIPIQVGSPFSLFALGTYAAVDRTVQNRAAGNIGNTYGADFGGVTAGVMYQATPNLVLGAAFNYLNTSVDLRGPSNGRIDLDSFQGAGFASLSFPNFFADAAFTYGSNNYTVSRPGALNDRLSAAPGGDTFTASARIGYLFDLGAFQAGPIGEVAYANAHVAAYRESGDPLLSIGVRQQNLEGLTAGGGVQVRATLPAFGGLISPFLNVTAQHDFLDGVRTVTSFQTYAPSLLIRTQTGRFSDDVYGRVAGGLDVDLGNGLSGVITGSTSFARSGGDDHTVSAGLRYRF
ncbi:Esterase EstA [Methylobacterium iners]|uniref:Esterase EstA n=1 Tax=Methylobacterium iners TaxID=418707 RepID=A0ABQ4S7E4_9HYPH|nr:Esterase EstA [Methylobacterium iners]